MTANQVIAAATSIYALFTIFLWLTFRRQTIILSQNTTFAALTKIQEILGSERSRKIRGIYIINSLLT